MGIHQNGDKNISDLCCQSTKEMVLHEICQQLHFLCIWQFLHDYGWFHQLSNHICACAIPHAISHGAPGERPRIPLHCCGRSWPAGATGSEKQISEAENCTPQLGRKLSILQNYRNHLSQDSASLLAALHPTWLDCLAPTLGPNALFSPRRFFVIMNAYTALRKL